MKNIVLIGMPGCGKSTVGKIIAKKTGKKLVDTDEEIVKKIEMPIADYFKKYSHEEFRKVEVQVISELSKLSDCVIASGGGAVLNPSNVENFRKNGIIYFLDRKIETLVRNCHCNDGKNNGVRPLVKSEQDVINLYNERMPIYKTNCDVQIEDNPSADFLAQKIINLHLEAES